MNGRALDHYEVNLDGGGWTSVGKATSFDASGGGWDKTRKLERPGHHDSGWPGKRAASTRQAATTPLRHLHLRHREIQAHNSTCPGQPGQDGHVQPERPILWRWLGVQRSEGLD